MVRTQIQLPQGLYEEVKRVAREREMPVAEVVRRGVEYITRAYPPVTCDEPWRLPAPSDLGAFKAAPERWPLIAHDAAGQD